MKLLHLSDLHIGKRVNECSMLEDQRYILEQIAQLAIERKVDGVLLAGDLYDKPVPPAEAVILFLRRSLRQESPSLPSAGITTLQSG